MDLNLSKLKLQYDYMSHELRNGIFRKSIPENELLGSILHLDECLGYWKHAHLHTNNDIESTIEVIMKCLRNSCISCERNQNIILQTNAVSLAFKTLQQTMEEAANVGSMKGLQSMCIQFLGNLVSGNCSCQEAVWKAMFPNFAKLCLQKCEFPATDLFCMVIFNCMKNRHKFIFEDGFMELLLLIIDHCKENDAEWGLFIMEAVISDDDFSDLYKAMDNHNKQRLILLDLLLAFLEEENLRIPERTLLCISDEFEKSATLVTTGTIDTENVELLLRYLKILCTATTHRNKYEKLSKKQEFVEHTIYLLKYINEKEELQKSSPASHESKGASSISSFKRYLVRIIGNVCHENKPNQDLVRTLHGIPAILSNCRIEDNNPYLCQWAIFAIRNLCKNNTENQNVISGFKMQGVDKKILQDDNIEANIVDEQFCSQTADTNQSGKLK